MNEYSRQHSNPLKPPGPNPKTLPDKATGTFQMWLNWVSGDGRLAWIIPVGLM